MTWWKSLCYRLLYPLLNQWGLVGTPRWIQYTEQVVAAGHPTLSDVTNRPIIDVNDNFLVEHSQVGVHKFHVCYLGKSASQSIPDGLSSWTLLTWDQDTLDPYDMHSVSTNTERINILKTGIYIFGANIAWTSNSTGIRGVTLFLDGTSSLISRVFSPTVASAPMHQIAFNPPRRLTAGQFVQVGVMQNSGGALSVLDTTGGGTRFGCVYLGDI